MVWFPGTGVKGSRKPEDHLGPRRGTLDVPHSTKAEDPLRLIVIEGSTVSKVTDIQNGLNGNTV